MNCKKVLSRLQAYVDEEVPAMLRNEMGEHLDSCPACSSRIESIREVGETLDTLTVPPLSQEFCARVMEEAKQRVPSARERESFYPHDWQPLRWLFDLSVPLRLAACTAVLLACFLGMFMSKEVSLYENRQASLAETENLDGFEWFSPAPPASLGSAYLTLAEATADDPGGK